MENVAAVVERALDWESGDQNSSLKKYLWKSHSTSLDIFFLITN